MGWVYTADLRVLQEARDKTFLTNAQDLQDGRTVDLLYAIIEVLFPEMTEYIISKCYRHKAQQYDTTRQYTITAPCWFTGCLLGSGDYSLISFLFQSKPEVTDRACVTETEASPLHTNDSHLCLQFTLTTRISTFIFLLIFINKIH